MKAFRMRRLVATLGALTVMLAGCGQGGSGETSNFYDGETITIDVAVAPGGAVDATARLWAKWLPEFLEGDVNAVVTNSPGGGQITSPNTYHNITSRDGLTLWVGSPTTHLAWRFDNAGVEYDLADWEALIAQPGGSIWYTDPDTSGITSIDNLVDGTHEELFVAGQVPSGSDLFKLWALYLLDVPVHVTWGYDGRGPARVAFEQGEANINTDAATALPDIESYFESGDWLLLFTMGQIADGGLVRDPVWPELPHTGDVYEMKFGEPPSGEMFDAYMMQMAVDQGMGRTLWIHGDAPEEARAALHAALGEMVQDPGFLEESRELMGQYAPVVGEQLEQVVDLLVGVDPAIVDFMVDFVLDEFGHDIRS